MFTKIHRVALIALVAVSSATLATGSLLVASSAASAAGYTFTSIDVPGASQTLATAINDAGQIVGTFQDQAGTHAFVKSAGGFEQIEEIVLQVRIFPAPPDGEPSTRDIRAVGSPSGINDVGQIVGTVCCGTRGFETIQFGFLRDTDGTFTLLELPGKTGFAIGINNAGQIVGYYQNPPISPGRGYIYSGGQRANFNVPGADGTRPWSINSAGQIAGYFYSFPGDQIHGFLYSSGTFTTIDWPGAEVGYTIAHGINDAGQIVGTFQDAGAAHGFVFSDGSFTQIDVPFVGAHGTSVFGINDGGQIVGRYYDAMGVHGFLADPMPPFAGTPGNANCHGKSVSALARQFRGLNTAAAALGFPSVQALQDAIREFCGG